MIPQAIQAQVRAKINEGIKLAEHKYGITVATPAIQYNLRGTVAGTANYRAWSINLNKGLLLENVQEFLDRTVPHELAHLITFQVYPQSFESKIVPTRRGLRRTKRDLHGSYWQEVMRTLGIANIKRCHSYDVTATKVHKTYTRYEYHCARCNEVIRLSAQKHKKLQQHPGSIRHRSCPQAALRFVGTVKISTNDSQDQPAVPQPAAPTPAAQRVAIPARPTAALTGSKLDRCYGWYNYYKDEHTDRLRQMCIAVFIQEVGMTKAGASTYYNLCQKMAAGR